MMSSAVDASKWPAVAALAVLLLSAGLATAWQDVSLPAVSADDSVSVEQLDAALAAVEAREDLDDETRTSVIERLRDAQAQVQIRVAAENAAQGFAAQLETAAAEAEALRAALDEEAAPAPSAESLGITDDTALADLEQSLTREESELSAIQSRLAELETQIAAQEQRPQEVRARIDELRSSREELAAALDAPAPAGEVALLTEARRLANQLRRAAQAAEINRLEQELLSHNVRLSLMQAQRDTAARSRVDAERRVEVYRAQVNEKRQAAAVLAQEEAAAAELAAADKHPVVRTLAEGNATLTRELPDVAAEIERASSALGAVESETKDIEQRLARSQQRLDVGGVSRVIGRLLIDERRNLPQVSQYRADVRDRRSRLAEIGLAQVRIQEQRRELTPIDSSVDAAMAEVSLTVEDESELASIREEVRLLLRGRRDLLNQAESTYSTYLHALSDLDVAQRRLLDLAAEYKVFLDQNLMWIPSAPIIGTGSLMEFGPALNWALSPTSWAGTLAIGAESLQEHRGVVLVAALGFIVLIVTRKPLVSYSRSANSKVGRLSTDSIFLTFSTLAIAALFALPLPLLLAIAGGLLENAPQRTAFSGAVASGLFATAPFLYNLRLFRIFCARDGVAQVHFGWEESKLAVIRRQMDRLTAIAAPLAFVTVLFYASDVAADRATLGRLCFVALMIVLAWSVHPLAHPETGVVADYYRRKSLNWVSKLRWVWYGVAAMGPLVLAAMALLGYIYTSSALTGLLVDTIWLGLSMVIVNLVGLRWLALARRKLAWQMALKEREAQKAEREKEEDDETEGEVPVVETKPLDLDEVDLQTRKLLQSGLLIVAVVAAWGIWAEFLPAFGLLDKVALWSQMVTVDGVETVAPVTLADLLLALLVAGVTTVASRNLPGLMEIAVLQRLTLEPGRGYTVNTLLQYFVVTIGVIAVLNIVGWNWSQIQWLVAALSVGLGFGLQEIVANFVAGLIILFERPVRVGDTVTVGQITGSVSKVRIRATTITDWDRKEIIVPNKSFITEQVINWTLSDPITRVVVPVGISYGSDVELAHRVMEETVKKLPLVLEEPEPKVFFLGFGESSLDFKLYVYSRQLSDRLPLMHAVHETILAALRENGIEIPFPQRDLHVRSTVESAAEKPKTAPRPAKASGRKAS
jgi:potassium efflux system protein